MTPPGLQPSQAIDCFVLPAMDQPVQTHSMDHGNIRLRHAVISPQALSPLLDSMIRSGSAFLSGLSTGQVLEIIQETADRWLTRKDPNRQAAERGLPVTTGLSPPMVRSGLNLMLRELTQEKLGNALDRSLGNRKILDAFCPVDSSNKRFRKAVGPGLTAHFLSGNVPALGIGELVQSLLSKSACFFKVSSREPLSIALFAQSLIETEARLSGCVAVMGWKNGTSEAEDFEEIVFKRSELVTATGSDEAVSGIRESWAAYSPVRSRFIGYSHRFSLGLIGRESLQSPGQLRDAARQAARDTALYDQQGCLSPHLFYVEEGGGGSPLDFAGALAAELEALEKDLPRGSIDPGPASQIQQVRTVAEMKGSGGDKGVLFKSREGTSWTVIYETEPDIALSPLFRTVRVKSVKNLEDVISHLGPWQAHLQSLGVSAAEDRMMRLSEAFGNSGFNRICPLGKMQEPPADWSQDGHRFLLDRLRWVDLEKP